MSHQIALDLYKATVGMISLMSNGMSPDEREYELEATIAALLVLLYSEPTFKPLGVLAIASLSISNRNFLHLTEGHTDQWRSNIQKVKPIKRLHNDDNLLKTATVLKSNASLCNSTVDVIENVSNPHKDRKIKDDVKEMHKNDEKDEHINDDGITTLIDADDDTDDDDDDDDDELKKRTDEAITTVKGCLTETLDQSSSLETFVNELTTLTVYDMLEILCESSDVIQKIELIMNCIFSARQWRKVLASVLETVLLVVEKCVRLYMLLGVCVREWSHKKLKGKLVDSCRQLRDKLVRTVDIILESFGTAGQVIRKQLDQEGIKMRFMPFAQDYHVNTLQQETLSVISSRRYKTMRMKGIIMNYDDEGLSGSLTISEMQDDCNSKLGRFEPLTNWTDDVTANEEALGSKLHTAQDELIDFSQIQSISLPETNADSKSDKPQIQGIESNINAPTVPDAKKKSNNSNLPEEPRGTGKKIAVKLTEKHRQLMREKCKEMLNSVNDDAINTVAEFRDTEALPQRDQEDLKYLLLARITKGLQSRMLNILRDLTKSGDKQPEPLLRQQLRFVFLVDNSGSMYGDKMTLSLTILTIFLETLKRLECESAVVRFGGEETQQLLKSFEDKMTNERGQFIIEAFDATEKTLAADAVKYVAESEGLFKSKARSNEHRFIVLITDGIWSQVNPDDYNSYFSKTGVSPLILTTHPKNSDDLHDMSVRRAEEILNSIAYNSWCGLYPEEKLEVQIADIAKMLKNGIACSLKKVEKTARYKFSYLKLVQIPPLTKEKPTDLKYKNTGDIEWGNRLYTSNKQCSFDSDTAMNELVTLFNEERGNVIEKVAKMDGEPPSNESSIADFMEIIDEKLQKLSDRISDVENILDCVVLPNNRPTRALQDYHGATFSLRGFIRFICTDGQYKKIYENVTGHPRKDYRVSVILDTSASMAGMTAVGSIETFLVLAASLQNCDVEFSLSTAAEDTNIVKTFDREWDDVAKARAYSAIQFDEQASNIADSILYSTQMILNGGSSKTVRMMFVITDGYDSCPGKLRLSLANAELDGVVVVGIGVGYFTDAVREFFPRHIIINNPSLLAKGLNKLFSGDEDHSTTSSDDVINKHFVEEEKSIVKGGKTLQSVHDIWEHKMKTVYDEEVEKTRKALYFATSSVKLKCSILSMDLCFVMDTTGSMTGYIEMAKKYTLDMVNTVDKAVEKYGKVLELRIGFVSYKFFGNRGHCDHRILTKDVKNVCDFIGGLNSSGGGGYEDKFSGLEIAVKMDWTAHARFLVLIGDQPDNRWVKERDTFRGVIGLAEDMAQKKIHFMHVRIDERTDREREDLEKAYKKAASPEMKTNGFIKLDLKGAGGSDTLAKAITDEIENVVVLDFM